MKTRFAFGQQGVDVEVPTGFACHVAHARSAAAIRNVTSAIDDALDNPIGCEPLVKLAEGKLEPGLKKLDQAANMELHMMYSEPPYYPRPVLEALGQAALKNGKLPEAESAFRRALEQYPGSHRAQVGLRAALDRKTDARHKTVAAGF